LEQRRRPSREITKGRYKIKIRLNNVLKIRRKREAPPSFFAVLVFAAVVVAFVVACLNPHAAANAANICRRREQDDGRNF